MKPKTIAIRVTDSDVQQGMAEAAQLIHLTHTIKQDPPISIPGDCPQCHQPFEVFDSIEMHHYLDDRLGIEVTRWLCADWEYCTTCHAVGRESVDHFETPRYPRDGDIWIEQKLKREKPHDGLS